MMTNQAPPTDLMTCSACGARSRGGLGICLQCGQRLFDENQPAPRANPHLGTTPAARGVKRPALGELPAEQRRRLTRWVVVAIAAIALLAAIAAIVVG